MYEADNLPKPIILLTNKLLDEILRNPFGMKTVLLVCV